MSFTDPSNNDPLLHDIFTVGALTAGLPALGYLQNKNEAWGVTDKLTKFSQKLVGSDYLNNQMNRTLVSTTSSQLLSNSEQSLQKVLLSQFMALEEASPLHVLRTLQISNFLQPFTPLSSNNETVHISANSIRNQQHYYESLIKYINEDEQRKIKRKLEIKDLTRGMFFKNNTLYGVDSKGAINLDDVIIKNARLTMGSLKNGDIYSNNHILEKFANIIGSSVDKTGVKNSPLMVVGAKNGMDFSSKWMQSTLRFSMEVGYKTLDNPLAGIEEMFHGVGAGYTGVFQSNIWNKMKEISGKVQLGTNGNYNLGIKDSLKLSAKNIAVKGGATYLAYQGVDSVLRSLSPENGIFSEGLGTGLANVYASSRIAFAKVWSDKFQGYKEQQEQSAPGSTDLSTLLAFPLAGALAGAQIAYFNRIGMSSIKGIDQAANIYNVEKESKVLKSVLNFDTKLKPMKRNALIGGLIGGSLALPFLPGALIGSSSEELRQLYSGEKEVPEKSTKFWLFGGGAWDGCLIDTAKLIQLSGKLVQAKDIKVGDKLLTSSGNFEPVKKILSKTVNDKIYSVKTSFNTNGDTQITGNHEILTIHHTGGFSPSKLETSKIIKEWIPVELVKKSPYVRLFVPYYKPLEIKKEICFDLSSFNYFYDEALKSWVRVFENKLWSKNMNKEVEKISLLKCNTKLRNKLSKDFKLKYGISDIQFKNKLNDIRKAKKLNRISNQIKLSNFKSNKLVLNADLGLLLGFYAAEGCVTEDGRIIFSFHEDELEYQKKVLELMLLIFNLKGSIKRNKGKGICLVFCDKVISKMIQQMIPGKTIDKTKRMNEYLLDAPEDFCYKFLEGVIKGDGSLGTFNSSIVIGMTDCPLPRQIQLLLTRFKIFSSIVRKKVHDLWDSILLNIPSSACYELNRKIEIKTLATNTIVKPKKNFGYTRLDDGFAVSIKSIETSEYNGIVYDFEIDGESNFFGTGFLLHNSHIKFHTKNWVARARADATDKVRYGDDETKKKLDPFLHPFSYLKDPYKLEKRNAESMPYPVWGMDVSYGSFFGKIFERTVGQIIKPDVINPAYKDAIMQGTEYTPVASSEAGVGALGTVASDVLHAKQNVGKSFVEASKSLFSSSSNKKLQGIDNKDASLINEGLMLAPNTPGYDPNQEGMSLSYRALMDFTGIKGWGSSLVVDGLGLEPGVNSIQLARSGEASNGARDLLEQNLGDLMGCFTPEMKVKTINGYKQIQQIQIGDLVLSKGGVYRPVKQVFKKEFKDIKILKVATSTINKEIYCTPDHVFPGLKREKYSCRRPKDLDFNLLKDRQIVDYNVGDYLLIPSISLKNKLKHIQVDVNKSIRSDVNQLTLEVFNLLLKNPNLTRKEIRGSGYLDINAKDGLSTYRKLINNKGIVINLPLNKDIGKLIGWWLAEGSLEKSGRITYSMCNDEEFFADELNTIVNKYFKISGYKSFNNANNSMSFRFNHKGFSDLLERTFNIGAINKTIPEYFKHSNIEFIKGLVYGLIHGDGWFNHKNAGFTSISNKLANDVSDLLRILGINHSLLENYNEKRKSNSLPNNREVKSKFYSRNNIHINIQSSIKLRKILEVNIDEQESKIKDNKSFIYESNQYVKIKAIDVLLYSGDMYDLEIDGSDSDKELDVNYYTIEGVLCHNSGEFQRKLLPTSSGALPDRFNPIANNAPSWLPSDKSQYFVDFKHGNMYDAVDRGEERLPGVGLESLYPELKGVDAEDYSLVFKHKILSNVAKGSEEFINTRKQAIDAYQQGKLSANEIDILGTTLDQELERDRKKDFYDTPSKFQGPVGSVHNALWETMRANAESPLEMLTPIRPAAKFLHKRTAIEDYMETQLGGPDTAIWTNPYSHFIKPALNKTRQSLDVSGTFIPEEAKEKFNIDEYFDKFKYLKARRSNSEFQSDSTVIGASMSGLNTKDKVLKFKRSLQDDQKDYFDSFSQETNIDKRNKIRAMLPEDVRRGYEQIWHNMDIAKKARSRGSNIQEAIGDSLSEQTDRLSSLYNVDLTTEDKQKARAKVAANSDNYVGQGINTSKRIQYTEDELLRRKMADREALTYVNSKTGVPNTGFVGWDPRLTMDDIKIRTLSIGGQDLKRFGYWKKDEERMNRLQGIVNTDTVFTDIDRIKEDIRSDRRMKRSIENVMFDNGFRASKIDLVDSNYSSILVREE